jgi:tRNA(Arg) A34 adenosine deaminase TadA
MEATSREELMRRAIALSLESVATGGGPFGCVIARDGIELARGTNRVTATHDPTAHAEVVAIRAAAQRVQSFTLAGCEVFTSCEPCPMCLAALWWARVARVYFGNTRVDAAAAGFDDKNIYDELGRPLGERRMPLVPLLRDEALAAFSAWKAKADRVEY